MRTTTPGVPRGSGVVGSGWLSGRLGRNGRPLAPSEGRPPRGWGGRWRGKAGTGSPLSGRARPSVGPPTVTTAVCWRGRWRGRGGSWPVLGAQSSAGSWGAARKVTRRVCAERAVLPCLLALAQATVRPLSFSPLVCGGSGGAPP